MPNNLQVTLDKSTTPWCVDIDQSGNANHVNQSPNVQTITWQLTGNAASGSFVALTDPDPGFAWAGTAPPSGVFGSPTLSANGNQLTISDLNNNSGTAGSWSYILRVSVDGVVYQSKTTSLAATTSNPTIVNK